MTTEDKKLNNTQHSTTDTWYPQINTEIEETTTSFGDRPIFPNTPEHYRQVDLNAFYSNMPLYWPNYQVPMGYPPQMFPPVFPPFPSHQLPEQMLPEYNPQSFEQMLDMPILNVPTVNSMDNMIRQSTSTACCGMSSCGDGVGESVNSRGQKVYRLKFSFAPSVGSIGHSTGRCYPCAFFFQRGCTKEVDCMYCHLCSIDELHRRRRLKEFEYNHLQQVNMDIDKQTAKLAIL